MSKQGRAPKSKTKTKARTQGEGGASDILREQLRVLHEGGVSKSKDRARPSSALGAPSLPPSPDPPRYTPAAGEADEEDHKDAK